MKGDEEIRVALEGLPYIFFEKLISKKMKVAGVKGYKSAAAALIAHGRSGKKGKFTWDDGSKGKSKPLSINISDEELVEIRHQIDEFMVNKFPHILESSTGECAARMVEELKTEWPAQAEWLSAVTVQFRYNLEARWGKGLNLLRMLLTIFREQGDENHKRLRRRKTISAMQEVMFRLHARSCQVADEIITLLENGFADGAMARWRTLHELSVTALLMTEYGEELALRYIEHQFVEAKKGVEGYEKNMIPLGYKPISKVQKARIVKGYNAALQKYKAPFKTQYGWAAEHLKHPQPTFRDLEDAAKRGSMRSYYQMAGYNVHASAKGIFFRLGSLNDTVLAGRSNAGLTDAAQNTAYTLCLIHSLLSDTTRYDVTQIIAMKAIVMIRDEIPFAFSRAEKKLARDDRVFRRLEEAQRVARRARQKRKKGDK